MSKSTKKSTGRMWVHICCLTVVVFSLFLLNACDEINLDNEINLDKLNIGCEHTWGEWSVVTKATCENDGERKRSCSKCSSTETEAVSALSHEYGEWSVSCAATCTEEGEETRVCSHDPTHVENRKTEKTAHVYDKEVVDQKYLKDEATCTNAAAYYKSCVCGAHDAEKSESFEDGALIGHNYEQISFKDATCEADGSKVEKCSGCGDEKTTPITSNGHNYKETVVPPTCNENGYTEHRCSECGDCYTDSSVGKTGHLEFDDTVVPPTCKEGGYTIHKCKKCGFTEKIDLVPKSDHDYKYEVITDATCTNTGTQKVTCSHCDYENTGVIPIKKHDYKAVTTEATCTSDGYVTYTCACGNSYVEEGEKSEGHKWEKTVVAPLCTEKGYTLYKCFCGVEEKRDWVNATGHAYGEPTCSKPATCGNCGDVGAAATQEHKYGEGVVVKAPTCTENGIIKYGCEDCDHFYTEEIKAAGHDTKGVVWEESESCVDGECSYVKVRTAICNKCQETVSVESKPYEKHSYQATITKAATCSVAGEKQYKCVVCGERPERNATVSYSEASAHVWVETSSTETVKSYKCSECHKEKKVVHSSGNSANVGSEDIKASGGVSLGGTEIEFDDKTKAQLGELSESKDITVSVNKIEGKDREDIANEDQLKYIGDAPIYDLAMSLGEDRKISQFSGKVTVRIPYQLGEKEDPDDITVWYIDDAGKVSTVEGASYVIIGGVGYAVFETDHFSYYTVTKLTPEERCARDGHEYKMITQMESCTEDGYVARVCTRCGQTDSMKVIPALGHDWSERIIEKASCGIIGKAEHSCSRCEEVYYTAIAAITHKWVEEDRVEATCTESGYALYVCEHDKTHTYKIVLPQTGHNYTKKTVEPTCTAEGYTEHTCTDCGTSYVSDTVAKKDHSIVTNVIAPTCLEDGYTRHYCDKCNVELDRTDVVKATGHKHKEESRVDATCESDGTVTYTCTACGDVISEKIAATGHNYELVETVASTCKVNGRKVYKCANCEDSYAEELALSEHNFANGKCEICGDRENTCEHADLENCTVTYTFLDQQAKSCSGGVECAYTCPKCRQIIYKELVAHHTYERINISEELGIGDDAYADKCEICNEGRLYVDADLVPEKEYVYAGKDGYEHSCGEYLSKESAFKISYDRFTVSYGCEERTYWSCVFTVEGKEPLTIEFVEISGMHNEVYTSEISFDESTMTETVVQTTYCDKCGKVKSRITDTTKYVDDDVPSEYIRKEEIAADEKGSKFIPVSLSRQSGECKLIDGEYVYLTIENVYQGYSLDGQIAWVEQSLENSDENGNSIYFYASFSRYICGEKQIFGFEEEKYTTVTLPSGREITLICSNEAAEYDINGNCVDGYSETFTYKTVEDKSCELEATVTDSEGNTETYIKVVHANVKETFEFDTEIHDCSQGITIVKTCTECGEELEREHIMHHQNMSVVESIESLEVGCECGGYIYVVECNYCGYKDVHYNFDCDMGHTGDIEIKPSEPGTDSDEEIPPTDPSLPDTGDDGDHTDPIPPSLDDPSVNDEEGFGEIVYPTVDEKENNDSRGKSSDKEDIVGDIGTETNPDEGTQIISSGTCNKCGFTYKVETYMTYKGDCTAIKHIVYSFGIDSDGNPIKVINIERVQEKHNYLSENNTTTDQETMENGTVLDVTTTVNTIACLDCGKLQERSVNTVKRDLDGNILYKERTRMLLLNGTFYVGEKETEEYEYFTDGFGEVRTRISVVASYKYDVSGEEIFTNTKTYRYDEKYPCIVTVTEQGSDGNKNEYTEENHTEFKEEARLADGALSCDDGILIYDVCTACGYERFVCEANDHFTTKDVIDVKSLGGKCGGHIVIEKCACGSNIIVESYVGCSMKETVEKITDENKVTHTVTTYTCTVCEFVYSLDTWTDNSDPCERTQHSLYRFGIDKEGKAVLERDILKKLTANHIITSSREKDVVSYETDENGKSVKVVTSVMTCVCSNCGSIESKEIVQKRYAEYEDRGEQLISERRETYNNDGKSKDGVYLATSVTTEFEYTLSDVGKLNRRTICENTEKYNADGEVIGGYRADYEYSDACPCVYTIVCTYMDGKTDIRSIENHIPGGSKYVLSEGSKTCEDGVDAISECMLCGRECERRERVSYDHKIGEAVSRTESFEAYGCTHGLSLNVYSCACGHAERVVATGGNYSTGETYTYKTAEGLEVSGNVYCCSDGCGFKYANLLWEAYNGCELFEYSAAVVGLNTDTGEFAHIYVSSCSMGKISHEIKYEEKDYEEDGKTISVSGNICTNCGHIENKVTNTTYTDEQGNQVTEKEVLQSDPQGKTNREYSKSVEKVLEHSNGQVSLVPLISRDESYHDGVLVKWYEEERVYDNEFFCTGRLISKYYDAYSDKLFEEESLFEQHSVVDGKEIIEATCTQTGVVASVCERCGYSVETESEPTGHTLKRAPKGWECSGCGFITEEYTEDVFILEDLTSKLTDGTDYVVGYYNRYGSNDEHKAVLLLIADSKEYTIEGALNDDGRSLVYIDAITVAEMAKKMGFSACEYDLRLEFVTANEKYESQVFSIMLDRHIYVEDKENTYISDTPCTEKSVFAYKCMICGDCYSETREAGHDVETTELSLCDCGEKATVSACKVCGEITRINTNVDRFSTVSNDKNSDENGISHTIQVRACSTCGVKHEIDSYTVPGEDCDVNRYKTLRWGAKEDGTYEFSKTVLESTTKQHDREIESISSSDDGVETLVTTTKCKKCGVTVSIDKRVYKFNENGKRIYVGTDTIDEDGNRRQNITEYIYSAEGRSYKSLVISAEYDSAGVQISGHTIVYEYDFEAGICTQTRTDFDGSVTQTQTEIR